MDINDIPMVKVTWLDAQDSDGSWTDIEDIIDHEPSVCQEIGWLVHKDERKIVIMRSRIVTEDGSINEGGGHIAIPFSWVIKIDELKVNEEINNTNSIYPYQSIRTS